MFVKHVKLAIKSQNILYRIHELIFGYWCVSMHHMCVLWILALFVPLLC